MKTEDMQEGDQAEKMKKQYLDTQYKETKREVHLASPMALSIASSIN